MLLAEGLDPDDLRVRAGIDLVRWELSLVFGGDAVVCEGGPPSVCLRRARSDVARRQERTTGCILWI